MWPVWLTSSQMINGISLAVSLLVRPMMKRLVIRNDKLTKERNEHEKLARLSDIEIRKVMHISDLPKKKY